MSARLYVGNIPFRSTEQELRDHFTQIGPVLKLDMVLDRETGRPRGFAFLEMDEADAHRAIEELGGSNLGGRALTVNQAKERSGGGGRSHGGRERGGRESSGRNRDW